MRHLVQKDSLEPGYGVMGVEPTVLFLKKENIETNHPPGSSFVVNFVSCPIVLPLVVHETLDDDQVRHLGGADQAGLSLQSLFQSLQPRFFPVKHATLNVCMKLGRQIQVNAPRLPDLLQ